MNSKEYLSRINYIPKPTADLNTLGNLHKKHVYSIPFENLDIQNKTEIKLEKNHLFNKVVKNFRGGFCYELNYLFSFLLNELGFDVNLISAQIFDNEKLGPEFDHMAIIVHLNGEKFLVDVGFGDLFMKPLGVENSDIQFDGRNFFKIKNIENRSFLLEMSTNGNDFEKKYNFTIEEQVIQAFSEQCSYKQRSESSYFVKNKIVTLPTENGRKTIFNSKYIIKNDGIKSELNIESKKQEKKILEVEFNIK